MEEINKQKKATHEMFQQFQDSFFDRDNEMTMRSQALEGYPEGSICGTIPDDAESLSFSAAKSVNSSYRSIYSQ